MCGFRYKAFQGVAASIIILMTLQLIALILPLCIDTFAVSAALGTAGIRGRQRLHTSLFFTAFETIMPVVGLLAGVPLHKLLGDKAEIAAFMILIVFGLYTLLHSEKGEMNQPADMLRGWGLSAFLLGLTISLDEIAIGFTLGLLGAPVALIIALIGVQAFIFSQLGFTLGQKLSERYTNTAVKMSGLILFGLGAALAFRYFE
jgi:manganese efflux pump family protein